MTSLKRRDVTFIYIGGPTLLIQVGNICFLTDPTFDPAGTEYSKGPVQHAAEIKTGTQLVSKLAASPFLSAGTVQLRKTRGPAINVDDVPPVDVVLLTHDQHRDNLDNAGRAFLPRAGRVLTTVAGAARLQGNAVGLQAWGTYVVTSDDGSERVSITATPARHGPLGGEDAGGDVIGFCLEWAGMDGAIYVSGDTVLFGGIEDIAFIFKIQTAILFLGAAVIPAHGPEPRTMTAQEAVKAAAMLHAEHILPIHYEGWEHLSEGRSDIVRAFEAACLTNKLVWLEPGRHTELSRPQRPVVQMRPSETVFDVDFDRWLFHP